MSYSFDVIKKMAFEKEIEYISNLPPIEMLYERKNIIIGYMNQRIKEIDEKYGEEPKRS